MELGGESDDVVGKTAYRRRLQQTVELYSVLCRNSNDVLGTVAPTLGFPVVLLWFFWVAFAILHLQSMSLCFCMVIRINFVLSLDNKIIESPNWQASSWHAQDLSVKSSSW